MITTMELLIINLATTEFIKAKIITNITTNHTSITNFIGIIM